MSQDKILKELWRRGEHANAILSEAQQKIHAKFLKNNAATYVVECSRQLGKTFWACFLADLTARTHPNAQIRLATAFQVDLKSIILPNFKNVLNTCPSSLQPIYVNGVFSYPNGSMVSLVGLDKNPDKMRGNRILLTIIEEAGFCDSDNLKYVLNSVVFPAQLRESNARTVLISTPPSEGNDHYFCQLADELELKDSYIKLTIDESGLPIKQIDKLVRSLGGRESIAFRREALCERIVDTEKVIIPEFDASKHVQEFEHPDYIQFLTKYASLDTGVRDKTVILHGYYDFPKATLFIEHEEILSGSDVTSTRIHDLTKEAEEVLGYKNTQRFADSNDPININNISQLGMVFNPTSKDSLAAMINKVRVFFKDNRVVINPKCKFLIGTVRSALWNNTRTEFKRTSTYGHADALAALMYLVRNINEVHNPIPQTFKLDSQNTFWFNKPTSQSQKTLKKAFNFKL